LGFADGAGCAEGSEFQSSDAFGRCVGVSGEGDCLWDVGRVDGSDGDGDLVVEEEAGSRHREQ